MERPAGLGYESISTRTACPWPLTPVSSGNASECVSVTEASDTLRVQVAAARALWVVVAMSMLAFIAYALRATHIASGAGWLKTTQVRIYLCTVAVPLVLLVQSVDPMSLDGVLPLYISIGLDELLTAVLLCQVMLITDLLITAGQDSTTSRARRLRWLAGAPLIVAIFLGSEALAEFVVPASYSLVAGLRAILATGLLCVWTYFGVRQIWRIQLQMTESSTMSAVGTLGRKMRAHTLQKMRVKLNRFYVTNVLVGSTMVFTASYNLTSTEMSWGFDLSTPAFFMVHNLSRLLFVFYICLAMSFFTVKTRKEGSVLPRSSPGGKSTASDGLSSSLLSSSRTPRSPLAPRSSDLAVPQMAPR
jgi:hypothetical protein